MLAGARSCFLFSSLLVFSAVVCLPAQAQINGVPPSVTSMGFGGNFTNGVRPGVTSLGAGGATNNWAVFGSCCANFFLPTNPNTTPISEHHPRRKDRDKDRSPVVGVMEPVYVPYALADGVENDDDSPDADPAASAGPRGPGPSARNVRSRDFAGKTVTGPRPDADEVADPVATQPATVLVFKDGHQSDVLNYAIVGDTLFDFASGRTHKILLADLDLPATHKANDDRGVDFQIPAIAPRQ
jgi:hypothetical protein